MLRDPGRCGLLISGGHRRRGVVRCRAAPHLPPAAPAAVDKNDYSKPETWLCRPGAHRRCVRDRSDDHGRRRRRHADARRRGRRIPKAPIDCFYVYPTVSTDPTPNSDMTAGNEERNVVRQQFARFGSQCRHVRAAVPPGHARRACAPAMAAGGTLHTRARAAVRRRARCVEPLPEERQQRPRRRRSSLTRRARSS